MRLPLLLVSVLSAYALLAAPAGATTTVTSSGSQLTVTAGAGVANDITVGPGDMAGMVRIIDRADALGFAGALGCVPVAGGAECPIPATLVVNLGDGNDRLTASASRVAVTVDAGDGDDTIAVKNGLTDTVVCGAGTGDDTSRADAADVLAGDCEVPADTLPPVVRLSATPLALTNAASADFAFGAGEIVTDVECRLDAEPWAPCAALTQHYDVADGSHTFSVHAIDAAGNTGSTAYTWTVDLVRPQTQLTGGPASSVPVNTASATLTFASPDGSRFECSLDGVPWQACASPLTYTGLANGIHAFGVRAVDAAGNVDGTPATRTWNVQVDGAPAARIAVSRDSAGFTLDAGGSTDPDGGTLVYRWLRNGEPAGSTPTVRYAAPDHETLDVLTVIVIDARGLTGQASVAMRTRATTQTTAQQAMDVIRFRAGTRLAGGAKARIAALRAAIATGAAQVRIEGYSRPGGAAPRVSEARAQAVRALLATGGRAAPKVTVVGRGATSPAASNATAAGRARNDRVAVTVSYTGPAARLVTEQEGSPGVSRTNAPKPVAGATGRAPKLFAFWSAVPGAMRRLAEVGARVDVLAPNWYTLSPADGTIRGGRPNAQITALSRSLGFSVWPVVNATMRGSALIETPAGRAKIVERIGALAASYRLAGVTLDMEEMLPRQQAAYSALVGQLAAALHGKRRRLAVYAVRRTATDVDDGAAAYDWAALARSADLVLASGYNEHSATTGPGPITTQAGFGALAEYAAATSRAKVVPTMGAFGYQWSGGTARMISSADAERRWPVAAEVGSADGRPVTTGSVHTSFESAEDLWAREHAARRAGAQWIGLFSLGREPDRFWERSTAR